MMIRKIAVKIEDSGYPTQMQDMKDEALIRQALSLLKMYYEAVNDDKKVIVYNEKSKDMLSIVMK